MTERFSITRRIEIDMAHRIPDHKSKCFNLHGHRYVIEATCTGHVHIEGEQTGMVMDFGFLKTCMMKAIHDPCDHGMVLHYNDPILDSIMSIPEDLKLERAKKYRVITPKPGWKVLLLEFVPTAENLALVWYTELYQAIRMYHAPLMIEAPHLDYLTVWETPNCFARYPA